MVNLLLDKVQNLNVQVGVCSNGINMLAPTLWVALQQMFDNVSHLKDKEEETSPQQKLNYLFKDDWMEEQLCLKDQVKSLLEQVSMKHQAMGRKVDFEVKQLQQSMSTKTSVKAGISDVEMALQ